MTTKICALPGCGIEFVVKSKNPGQKYHSKQCGFDAKRLADEKRDKKIQDVTATFKARGVPSDVQHPNERVIHKGTFRIDNGNVIPT